ncbi:MAG: hypothetical protein NVSMB32_05790 [Actinomycetota bacterium]
MRRSVGIPLIILTALIIQTTVLPHLALFHVMPDLLLVVTICVALVQGPSAGAAGGFAGGLLRDFQLNSPTGISALSYLCVGYAVGAIRPFVQSSSVSVPLIGVFAGSMVGTMFYMGLSRLLGVPAEPLSRLSQVVLLTALYNTLLVPFAYPLVRHFAQSPYGESAFPGRAA